MPTNTTWVHLRVVRTKDGHSITSLAKAAGMSVSYLSELESGAREPNAKIIKKLAVALNVPVSLIEKVRYHPEAAA
jgi:transcriptional regulator with XRE-family HTH domain